MQDTPRYFLQAARGGHPGLQSRSDRSDYHVSARTCHRRRRSRRKPAAASGTRPSRMHVIMNMPLAGSPAVAIRPAEAARCLEVVCEHPDARLPSAICQMRRELKAPKANPIPIRDQCQLQVGWARLARAVRLAPTMSGDSSRSNARGRSDLHSPNDAWTSQTHGSPGMLQDRRGMNAASSPFRQNGVARLAATDRSGFRRQIDGIG